MATIIQDRTDGLSRWAGDWKCDQCQSIIRFGSDDMGKVRYNASTDHAPREYLNATCPACTRIATFSRDTVL